MTGEHPRDSSITIAHVFLFLLLFSFYQGRGGGYILMSTAPVCSFLFLFRDGGGGGGGVLTDIHACRY